MSALWLLTVAAAAMLAAPAEMQVAGDARDDDPCAFTAVFPCGPEEVAAAYGRKYAVLVDGVDACSWEYARATGFSRPRRPVYQDLSDQAGWPRVHVQSGTVAIDPRTGRLKFAEGDTTCRIERQHFVMTAHGMAHLPVVRGRIMLCPNGETWSGIRAVDISDPARPRDLTTLDVGCFGKNGVGLGDRMYCHTSYHGTTILDITDPSRPVKIGHWRVPPPAHHGGHVAPFRLGRREYFYCFVKPEGGWKDWPKQPSEPKPGLRLVEVTNPAKPVEKNLGSDFMFATVDGHHAYHVAKAATDIYDISNPESPRKVGTLPGSLGALTLAGNRIYASRGDTLVIFDNSSPAAPREIGQCDGLKRLSGIAVRRGHAYVVTEGNTLVVLDVSEPGGPKRLGSVTAPKTRNCASVTMTPDGSVAIVPDAGEGFGHWLFDVADPAHPREVGRYYSAGEIQHLLVSGGLATASLEWGGVQALLDVSYPLRMRLAGCYHSGRFDDYADALRGKIMYFGKGASKTVVDVSDPSAPKEVGSYETEERPWLPVRFWADTGFTLGELKGKSVLTAYDYGDPRSPKKLGRCELGDAKSSRCHSLATDGRLLAAVGKSCLILADVGNPAAMSVLGRLDDATVDPHGAYGWQGSGRRLGLRQGFAYGIRGSEGADDPRIAVYDVRDPKAPRCVYVTPETRPTFQDDWSDSRLVHQGDMFNDLIVEGRYMYVNDYWGGVRVYDLSDPAKPAPVDFEFEPYFQLVGGNWSREEYKKAVASGDLHKYLGITPQQWARRFEIGAKLTWTPMEYHPGYELYAWNIGELLGDYLCQPKLGGVAVYRVKRSPEAPRGKVVVQARRG